MNIMNETLKSPFFKYCLDPFGTGLFRQQKDPVPCSCCGRTTQLVYDGPFYTQIRDVRLCPECVHSGAAAAKFEGMFADWGQDGEACAPEAKDELAHKTPSPTTWQDFFWPVHCGDFCAFVAYVGYEELVAMGLAESAEPIEPLPDGLTLRDLQNGPGASPQGYLFRCLGCGKNLVLCDFG